MSHAERLAVYKAAFNKFGRNMQIVVAIEELSELTKELCKTIRYRRRSAGLLEELADAQIVIEQMRELFDPDGEVEELMAAKVQRLEERIRR